MFIWQNIAFFHSKTSVSMYTGPQLPSLYFVSFLLNLSPVFFFILFVQVGYINKLAYSEIAEIEHVSTNLCVLFCSDSCPREGDLHTRVFTPSWVKFTRQVKSRLSNHLCGSLFHQCDWNWKLKVNAHSSLLVAPQSKCESGNKDWT